MEPPHGVPADALHEYTLSADDALRLHEARSQTKDAECACLKAEHRLLALLSREGEIMREIAAARGFNADEAWTLHGRTLRRIPAK